MNKDTIKIAAGAVLLVPGLALWLGPLIIQYGLLTFIPIVVALMVVGGLLLVLNGTMNLREHKTRQKRDSRAGG